LNNISNFADISSDWKNLILSSNLSNSNLSSKLIVDFNKSNISVETVDGLVSKWNVLSNTPLEELSNVEY